MIGKKFWRVVKCSDCKKEYPKRTDSIPRWKGRCQPCTSRLTINQIPIAVKQKSGPSRNEPRQRRMVPVMLAFYLILFLASPVFATTYYIDFVGGSDGNNGTAKGTAWKRCPGMRGFSGTYTHVAGDWFVFKGGTGAIWPTSALPLTINFSGSAQARDFYTVDLNWFNGPEWTRPQFDKQKSGDRVVVFPAGTRYVTINNLEIKNPLVGSNFHVGCVLLNGNNDITIQNCKIGPWYRVSQAQVEDGGTFGGVMNNPFGQAEGQRTINNVLVEYCEIFGQMDGPDKGIGGAFYYGGEISHCYIHDVTNANLLGAYSVHDSEITRVNVSVDAAINKDIHTNILYVFASHGAQSVTGSPIGIYNNYIHDCTASEVIYLVTSSAGNEVYRVYNNVLVNVNKGIGVDQDGNTSTSDELYVYNNTFKLAGASFVDIGKRPGQLAPVRVDVFNNHFIGGGTVVANDDAASFTLNQGSNLTEGSLSSGYNATTLAPIVGTATGVNAGVSTAAGVSLASLFTTDRLGATRPQDAVWDRGAYEWGGVAPDPTTTPTPVPTPSLSASPAVIDFGSVQANATPADKTITVTNNGGASGTLSLSLSAPFSIVSQTSPISGSGGTGTVVVRYRPTAKANDSTTLTIGNSTVTIKGICYPNLGTTNPSLTVDADDAILTAPFVATSGDVWQTVQTTDPSPQASPVSGRLSFGVTVATAGDYKISGTMSVPNTGADSFFINVDGEPTSPTMIADIQSLTSGSSFASRDFPWRGNGAFDSPQFNPKVFTLTAADHEIVIRGREPLAKLRQIKIEPLSTPPPQLTAVFSTSPSGGTEPLLVTANITLVGGTNPVTTSFDWGDGTVNTSNTHTFAAGNYTIRVTATDSSPTPQTLTVSSSVVVDALTPLSVVAGATPTSGAAPLDVDLTATPAGGNGTNSFSWVFSDGSTSTSQNPSHTFAAGDHTATVTVQDTAVPPHVASDDIAITSTGSPALDVALVATPNSGTVPFSVSFDSTVSGGSGTGYVYSYSFGDGDSPATIADPSHNYTVAGNYSASVTVTDSLGATRTVNVPITALGAAPSMIVRVFASSESAVAPATIGFNATITGNYTPPVTYLWDFGDDSETSTEVSPTHTYTKIQESMVTLQVEDANGLTSESFGHITTTLPGLPTSYINISPP